MKQSRDKIFQFRVTEDEKNLIADAAKQTNDKPTSWARAVLLKAANSKLGIDIPEEQEPAEDKEAIAPVIPPKVKPESFGSHLEKLFS